MLIVETDTITYPLNFGYSFRCCRAFLNNQREHICPSVNTVTENLQFSDNGYSSVYYGSVPLSMNLHDNTTFFE